MSERNAATVVLACGAWLKNAACLRVGAQAHWSAVHGDLGDPAARIALDASIEALLDLVPTVAPGAAIAAVAHDLHPDFYSTGVALRVAAQLGVPAIAVQHHHAHIGVVMEEFGLQGPVIGLALDGVGLGTDGVAWGGELLWLEGGAWRRLGHFQPLPLPGGDVAAREPWRMAAAALHAMDRTNEISQRFSDSVGQRATQTVQAMLTRRFNCPATTGAGRWFDAAAGALRISSKQTMEAQAAIAMEKMATDYLAAYGDPLVADEYVLHSDGRLDLRPLLSSLFALADSHDPQAVARGAALFHLTLINALVAWVEQASQISGTKTIALGGGCFLNRLLCDRLSQLLKQRGYQVFLPHKVACGDSGLAIGQAWVARQQLQPGDRTRSHVNQDLSPAVSGFA